MLPRRDFLRSLPLISLAPTIPGFLARSAKALSPEAEGRILVVIQLDGGNDGINTVVPFGDEGYAKHRKTLKLETDRLIKVSDGIGLHPAMGGAGKLLESGRLAIVPGVGYPNPNRSHFESMAIWQTARLDPEEHSGPGWIGRSLDASGGRGDSLYVGPGTIPAAIRGRRAQASAIERIDDLTLAPGLARQVEPRPGDDLTAFVRRSTLDAYAGADRLAELARLEDSSAQYPSTGLGGRLKLVSRLIKGGYASRVFYTTQGGYDTHSAQASTHFGLLNELSGALRAFLDDLEASKLADRVLVLAFSEFGRRVAENGSSGTDHGTAGPVLLAGSGVLPGLVGSYPSLTDLDSGDLKMSVDFRQVYATVLQGWLGLTSEGSLGGSYSALPLLKA
ncbi:DUF1501 domain-containing protein [Tundrisphaera lichenicola]|uniref:DUF1501 domain-containing protein n=1 Tax=Tundrisphaera lichenicola TaxID=2029860 RepID=UPI003EBEF103